MAGATPYVPSYQRYPETDRMGGHWAASVGPSVLECGDDATSVSSFAPSHYASRLSHLRSIRIGSGIRQRDKVAGRYGKNHLILRTYSCKYCKVLRRRARNTTFQGGLVAGASTLLIGSPVFPVPAQVY